MGAASAHACPCHRPLCYTGVAALVPLITVGRRTNALMDRQPNASTPDFYIGAFDVFEAPEPLMCWRIKRLVRVARWWQLPTLLRPYVQDEYLLVRTEPPVNVDGRQAAALLLAGKGGSLFPITEWPVSVFVLDSDATDLESRDGVRDDEIRVADWAMLFRDKEQAQQWLPRAATSTESTK